MEKRVKFDFEIYFTNGGSIKGEDFRLDIEGDTITDKELADYIVADLRLLMAGETSIKNKVIFEEKHKRKAIHAASDNNLLIDLSHSISHGLKTYRGLPAPLVCDYMSREDSRKFYSDGTEFHIGRIEMVTSTGTYIDSPFHRFRDGNDLAAVNLNRFANLDGIVIHVPFSKAKAITAEYLYNHEIRNRAVLLHTGWDTYWNTDTYFEGHPYLTEDAAKYLRQCNVKLVGIDSHNIDNSNGTTRPVHTILLGADILLVEHLCNLNLLPDDDFTFSAVPPKFEGVGTFPVRAFARVAK